MKFKKDELLEILQKNKDQHREIFKEACEGWRSCMLARLHSLVDDVKSGNPIKIHLGLSMPVDQTLDYDRAIKMLEMCVDDVIELDENTFANYVMDDWRWTHDFIASNVRYSKKARAFSVTKANRDEW